MIEQELEPWMVAIDNHQVALWKLNDPPAVALALFSTRGHAEKYVRRLTSSQCRIMQPSRRELLGLMIQCYQEQIMYAVLDPDESSAHRIFQLRDVLKAARSAMD